MKTAYYELLLLKDGEMLKPLGLFHLCLQHIDLRPFADPELGCRRLKKLLEALGFLMMNLKGLVGIKQFIIRGLTSTRF